MIQREDFKASLFYKSVRHVLYPMSISYISCLKELECLRLNMFSARSFYQKLNIYILK